MKIGIQEIGTFTFRVYDADGNLKQEKITSNTLTSEGAARILQLGFDAALSTPVRDTGYVGLIDDAGFASIASSDQATDIRQTGVTLVNGWGEIADTGYDSGLRKSGTWSQTDNGGTVTPSKVTWTDATFTSFAGTQTIQGAFLANTSAVGQNTTGVLFAASSFAAGDVNVGTTDTLKVTFEMSLS
jgi:hypothetical protein